MAICAWERSLGFVWGEARILPWQSLNYCKLLSCDVFQVSEEPPLSYHFLYGLYLLSNETLASLLELVLTMESEKGPAINQDQ